MRIALNLIMKDESKVILRMLKSVLPIIDTYQILDTGSTDQSIKIVKDFFDSHGVHGEIHVNTDCVEVIEGQTCFIYDKARNEALKLLKGKADYGFFIDCDEELTIATDFNLELFKNKLSKFDLGSITMISGVNYSRMCLYKVDKPFRWVGKIHEVLVCDEPITQTHIEGLSVIVHQDETDSDTNKFKQHSLVLQKQVNETNNPRDVFYLANSYKDAGEWEKAIDCYRKRVSQEGFYEERYYSQFMIGNLYWTNGKPFQETLIEFFKCSELDSLKCEHLFNAIIILQNNNLWHTAYMVSKSCVERFHKKSPYPERVLFLYEDVYDHRLLDVHLMNCQVLGITFDFFSVDGVDFEGALKSIPSGWKQNRLFANWLVKKVNPTVTVELGVDYGYSLFCLAESNKGKVYGIDNFKGDSFTGFRNTFSFVNNSIKWLSEKLKINNIKIIDSDIRDAVKKWNKNLKIDILHIDALATYDAVKEYYEIWKVHLKPNAIVLFHNSSIHEGVRKYFYEITEFKYEIKNGSGLGVVSNDEKLIDEIKYLFEVKVEIKQPETTEELPSDNFISEEAIELIDDISIAFIDHNGEVYSRCLEPSIGRLETKPFDILFTDDKEKPAVNYNKMLHDAETKYVLFVHQDISFGADFLDRVKKTIKERPDFGALGIVGQDKSDAYHWGKAGSIFEVEKLDCCCILVNKEHGIRFDEKTFDDFHLYVEDYCLQVKYKLGLSCYTINVEAVEANIENSYMVNGYAKHHSATVNERGYAWGRYWEYYKKLNKKWHNIGMRGVEGVDGKKEVDVVIISYAKNNELYNTTVDGILTIQKSEKTIKFNIFVVESEKGRNYNHYPNVKTIYTDNPFNYNDYLNIGIKLGSAPYVILANNDLTYEQGFASEIIRCMDKDKELLSASPFCPQVHSVQIMSNECIYGHTIREHICGWCIFVKRELFDIIGEINTDVSFWYSDNVFAEQLLFHKVKHALVTNSIVNHHGENLGVSGSTILDDEQKKEMMMGQFHYYIEARKKIYGEK